MGPKYRTLFRFSLNCLILWTLLPALLLICVFLETSENQQQRLYTSKFARRKELLPNLLATLSDTQSIAPQHGLISSDKRVARWKTELHAQQKRKHNLIQKLRLNKTGEWIHLGRSWEKDLPSSKCEETRFRSSSATSSDDSLYSEKVALASFPGAGNTWLRHLFHVTTGIWTGSLYLDPNLFSGGYPGEAYSCNDSATFGIKVHDNAHAKEVGCKFEKVVFVLRNPYRSILSEFNRRAGKSHTGIADHRAFESADWSNYALKKTKAFPSVMMNWFEYCRGFSNDGKSPSCMIINYSELVNDTIGQMTKVLTFLKLPLHRLHCLNCSKSDVLSGPFHRKHDTERPRQIHPADKDPICKLKQSVQDLLRKVIRGASEKLSQLKIDESYVQEISKDVPTCK